VAVNGPGVAATGSGATFVIEGGNGAVYQKSVSINGSSTGWQNLGGIAVNGAGATADGTSTSPPSSSNPIQQMLGLVNTDRTNAGLPPYTLNMTQSSGTATCVGSYGHSVAMAQSGSIWHVNPSYPQASFPNNICISYSIAGENVGMSQSGSETNDLQTINNLMMSEPHDASTCATTVNHACNILSTAFHQVGIGIYYANNTTWLTEDFTN
jgi:uncharacterized protein YkwD